MEMNEEKLTSRKLEKILTKESAFISNFFSTVDLPVRQKKQSEEEDDEIDANIKPPKPLKTPARSLTELQQRLEAITRKSSLSFTEKKAKNTLKKRLKKNQKLIKINKSKPQQNGIIIKERPAKPVYNENGNMVFSKFDFSESASSSHNAIKNKFQKKTTNKHILRQLEEQKAKMDDLQTHEETSKAIQLDEKISWRTAIAKSHGEKVKDDISLVKRSIKKEKQQKNTTKRKWKNRTDAVTKRITERQHKRTENLKKRKMDKKSHKIKRAIKKGRLIPGL